MHLQCHLQLPQSCCPPTSNDRLCDRKQVHANKLPINKRGLAVSNSLMSRCPRVWWQHRLNLQHQSRLHLRHCLLWKVHPSQTFATSMDVSSIRQMMSRCRRYHLPSSVHPSGWPSSAHRRGSALITGEILRSTALHDRVYGSFEEAS